jgi:NAD(P)H-dependent FMN reductase
MRSDAYQQGYAAAWKDAIEWLQNRAAAMNDEKATAILNSAAFALGSQKAVYRKINTKLKPRPNPSGSPAS